MEIKDWSTIVQWLVTGGAVVLPSWFSSWLLEDFSWWQGIKAQYKKLIILAVSLGVGSGAQYFRLHPELLVVIQPYLDTGALIILSWIATQVAHKTDKATTV